MQLLPKFVTRLFRRKSAPSALTGQQWSGTSYIDSFKKFREPTPNELMAELKNTAYACAYLNAAVCASNPPILYVASEQAQQAARCRTRPLTRRHELWVRSRPHLPINLRSAGRIEQVLSHPLLDLIQRPNPRDTNGLNYFDLLELTDLYQEVHGRAYWVLSFDALGVPNEIWLAPPQNMTPKRHPGSRNLVDYYQYRTGAREQMFSVEQVIVFKFPDPRNPYSDGLAPLRAIFEQQALMSDYSAMRRSIYENRAVPDALVTPSEVIGEEERDRLQTQIEQRFRRGGQGRVLVAESPMRVDILRQSWGDLAQLAEIRATMEDVCNAFHCPIAYFTTNVNMANLQAADRQHMANAIRPRLQRRDEKMNEQLVPLYDDSGRLFFASQDPTPVTPEDLWQREQVDLKFGVRTINEQRSEQGLAPVPYGDEAWLPLNWGPVSSPRNPNAKPDKEDQ
jgi:HK97 family phage portal protein